MKLQTTDTEGDYLHYCPACRQMHLINTRRKNQNGAQWTFDGNMEKPTFSPSINILKEGGGSQCHYFIQVGYILYAQDSHHDMKGQTIEMPEIPGDHL
jgi:hypothetical protein